MDKTWKIKFTPSSTSKKERQKEIIDFLISDRNLPTQELKRPTPESIIPLLDDLDPEQLKNAVSLIKNQIKDQKPILIYGDYDVDGVTATAILWRTLYPLNPKTLPFIPHRIKHGYGISKKGIKDALKKVDERFKGEKPLIITVDNGISAIDPINQLLKDGYQVIVTDHHQTHTDTPSANAIVHTTSLSGSGVSWLLASSIGLVQSLELPALGTVCDLLPLTGANRAIVRYGLEDLKTTNIIGLKEFFNQLNINPQQIDTYHLGFMIGPRINAAGRIGHALDALRLLCTSNQKKAFEYFNVLNSLNQDRRELTTDFADAAINSFKNIPNLPPILMTTSPDYHEGIIGLIAARLTEFFHRPAIAIAMVDDKAKASCRSIKGIDITSLLKQSSSYLHGFGGHEQAAGFSTSTDQLELLYQSLLESAKDIDPQLFTRTLDIDISLNPEDLDFNLLDSIQTLSPFGVENQQPVFTTTINIDNLRLIGADGKHLKIKAKAPADHLDIIGFNKATSLPALGDSKAINLAFYLQKNTFNGKTTLQLNLKDLKAA